MWRSHAKRRVFIPNTVGSHREATGELHTEKGRDEPPGEVWEQCRGSRGLSSRGQAWTSETKEAVAKCTNNGPVRSGVELGCGTRVSKWEEVMPRLPA